jgi:hypothetical protein
VKAAVPTLSVCTVGQAEVLVDAHLALWHSESAWTLSSRQGRASALAPVV